MRLSFPESFRDYLLRWGHLSFGGLEYYGLTRNADFDKSGVPNCVWFTLRAREQVGFSKSLVVFRNDDGDQYLCVNADASTLDGEIVIWDNIERRIDARMKVRFIDYLIDELEAYLEEARLEEET